MTTDQFQIPYHHRHLEDLRRWARRWALEFVAAVAVAAVAAAAAAFLFPSSPFSARTTTYYELDR